MTDEHSSEHVPVTFESYQHVAGPFFHGTKVALEAGDEVAPGFGSNFQSGRVSNNIYFSAALETAVWGAELATALAGSAERGRIYVVEPSGPFEDDPNVTNKRFPGNPTQSYRSRFPLRIVGEVVDWQGHAPEVLSMMLESLAVLREQGATSSRTEVAAPVLQRADGRTVRRHADRMVMRLGRVVLLATLVTTGAGCTSEKPSVPGARGPLASGPSLLQPAVPESRGPVVVAPVGPCATPSPVIVARPYSAPSPEPRAPSPRPVTGHACPAT